MDEDGKKVRAVIAVKPRGTLSDLAFDIRKINKANGWQVPLRVDWHDTNRIPAILALIHSEVSEALEAFRKGDASNFAEEVADILIRTLELAPAACEDIDAEVARKLERNKSRGFRHGGKRF